MHYVAYEDGSDAAPISSSHASTPVSAIVGGVIGSVAIVFLGAWFIFYRKRRTARQGDQLHVQEVHELVSEHQLDEQQAVHEADIQDRKKVVEELPAKQAPIELSAA
ncbi:hypothetical protein N0V90_010867 [Kalmusia sp. IMI 367209]|nr:hypothetical protein N0V90_010867 [Kalmusia sp. IMI 367209]